MIGLDLPALAELTPLLARQRTIAIVGAVLVTVLVFELVRRRKLREEYSVVWIAVAIAVAVLALEQDLLLTVSAWIGASSSVSTLFFGALVFLFALVLQFSVRLSRLTLRHRILGQRVALLQEELERLRNDRGVAPGDAIARKEPRGRDEVA